MLLEIENKKNDTSKSDLTPIPGEWDDQLKYYRDKF
jgi:hypothetical protein